MPLSSSRSRKNQDLDPSSITFRVSSLTLLGNPEREIREDLGIEESLCVSSREN